MPLLSNQNPAWPVCLSWRQGQPDHVFDLRGCSNAIFDGQLKDMQIDSAVNKEISINVFRSCCWRLVVAMTSAEIFLSNLHVMYSVDAR